MASTELLRDHRGTLHLYSHDRPVHGAVVSGVTNQDGIQQAIILVPMASLTVKEMDNVVPFVRPAQRPAPTPTVPA